MQSKVKKKEKERIHIFFILVHNWTNKSLNFNVANQLHVFDYTCLTCNKINTVLCSRYIVEAVLYKDAFFCLYIVNCIKLMPMISNDGNNTAQTCDEFTSQFSGFFFLLFFFNQSNIEISSIYSTKIIKVLKIYMLELSVIFV